MIWRFRPLIRGFFFYEHGVHAGIRGGLCVSVPSFGDSFFIKDMLEDEAISLEKVFPSPYSGILFL